MIAAGMYFSPGSSNGPGRAQSRKRVLVVDDDKDTVLTLVALLEDEGYEVKGAHTGADAIRALSTFNPEAILLDIVLQDTTGWDVAREVRKRRGERLLLIALSGAYTKASDRALGAVAGFDHYLTKPYDPMQVLALLAPLASNS